MEPHEYFATLRKRWAVIVAIGLIGAATGYAYASSLPAMYKSTSSVFVSSQRGETTSEILQGSNFTQAQVQSYAALAPLPVVLDPVIDDLDLDVTAEELASTVTADIRLNTVIIDVTVVNRSPVLAASIANAVTAELARQAEQLETRPAAGDAEATSPVTMTTVASAQVSQGPFSPNTRFIVLSGLFAGIALAVAGVLALEIFDTRVRTQKDIERIGPHAFLGVIAKRKRSAGEQIVMLTDPHGAAAEDFRRIGTNLDFADIDNPIRSVVVTSSSPGEGKSSTSVNLALAMAERFERVLLVDADLRKPSIAEYCQIEGSVGLTSVLVGSATLEQALRPWADGTIDVLPSGIVPANPSQMLGTEAMADLVGRLASIYDFIIIDSPPLLPVTDSLTIAKLIDGALVIAKSKSTRRQQLAQAVDSLEAVSARVIGTVLNGVARKADDAYYDYVDIGPEKQALAEPGDVPGDDVLRPGNVEPPSSIEEPDDADPVADSDSPSTRAEAGWSADPDSDASALRQDEEEGNEEEEEGNEEGDSEQDTLHDRSPARDRRPGVKRYSIPIRKASLKRATPTPKSG